MYFVYWNQAAASYLSLYFSFFFLSNFQILKFFVILFSGTVRPGRLKLGTHVDSGQMCRVYQNQVAAAYSSLYCSFFFLSNFQTLKVFVTLFSGTVRPRRLRLNTNVDNGWMHRVYWNQVAAAYLSLYFFSFLSLQFSNIKKNVTLFSGTVRPRRLKLGTHVDSGQMYCVHQNQPAAAYLSLYSSFFFLSNFQTLKCFVTLVSETVRPRRFRHVTHMNNRWMYCVYRNQAAAAYSSLYFFCNYSFSPIFKH